MKKRFAAIWLFFVLIMCTFMPHAIAAPKMRLEIAPTEDRWITFADSARFMVGSEIPHILAASLLKTGKYTLNDPQSALAARPQARLYFEVEEFFYNSGERSNRVHFGFTRRTLNPYNAGRVGAKDNEFTFLNHDTTRACEYYDFFRGQMDPGGGGFRRSNFGADFEGFKLSLAGYGFGFRHRAYDLFANIKMTVELIHEQRKVESEFELRGSGRDLSIVLKYDGMRLEVEAQRRKTLRRALDELLPELVDKMVGAVDLIPWETEILTVRNGKYVINAGARDGLASQLKLYTSSGQVLNLLKVDENLSYAQAQGPLLAPSTRLRHLPWSNIQMFSMPRRHRVQKVLPLLTGEDEANEDAKKCFGQKFGLWENLLDDLVEPFGYTRFKKVYDQEFLVDESTLSGPRIAIVSSGVYPREKKLAGHISGTGYDFISDDNRPSDDLGAGTAAAIYLKDLLPKDMKFTIVPYKIIDPRGQTHSSAMYLAFKEIASRDDIQEVMIPWYPWVQSEAMGEGIAMILQSGKRVIAPEELSVPGIVAAKKGRRIYYTKGIEKAKLRLAMPGRGVVERAAEEYRATYGSQNDK